MSRSPCLGMEPQDLMKKTVGNSVDEARTGMRPSEARRGGRDVPGNRIPFTPHPGGHMLTPGDKAPDFAGRDHNGKTVRLSDFAGKPVVLWFFPKADTPG